MNKNKMIMLVITLVVLVLIGTGVAMMRNRTVATDMAGRSELTGEANVAERHDTSSQSSDALKTSTAPSASPADEPSIAHIGVNLDTYNAATGMAGDFRFTKSSLHDGKLWTDYGYLITDTPDGKPKRNPQPTYILPLGTKVHSLVTGKVTSVNKLYSDDYSIHVAKFEGSKYFYETEHVTNPLVKVGDMVTAGQVIAEVSPHDSRYNDGMGLVEIGILTSSPENRPRHICPFAYLENSIKDEVQTKIRAFYQSWETYRGTATVYDEAAMPTPGCETLDPLDE